MHVVGGHFGTTEVLHEGHTRRSDNEVDVKTGKTDTGSLTIFPGDTSLYSTN